LDIASARAYLQRGLRPQSIAQVVNGRDRESERIAMLELLAEFRFDFLDDQLTTWGSAAKKGSPKIVEWLLDHGMPIEPIRNRWLPLHNALIANEVDVVELLLKRGASATEACMDRGNVAGFMEELENGKANYRYDSNYKSVAEFPLQVAAGAGNWRAVEVLVKYGANVNFEDFEGETALHCAAMRPDNGRVIRELVVRGADRRILSRIGETPLQVAQRLKHESNVRSLLRP
jgi:ankyrin repeat protein